MNDPKPKQMTKDQLKLLALKQRIGQLTSEYEDQMADMRADATQRFDALQDVLRQQETEIENLQNQLKEYQDRDLSQKKANPEDAAK